MKRGLMRASSGAIPEGVQVEHGVIKRWPWYETSLTLTPANPEAVAAAKSLGLPIPEPEATPSADPAEFAKQVMAILRDERQAEPVKGQNDDPSKRDEEHSARRRTIAEQENRIRIARANLLLRR